MAVCSVLSGAGIVACGECGGVIKPPADGRTYCGEACYVKARNTRKLARWHAAHPPRACGTLFCTGRISHGGRKWCKECAARKKADAKKRGASPRRRLAEKKRARLIEVGGDGIVREMRQCSHRWCYAWFEARAHHKHLYCSDKCRNVAAYAKLKAEVSVDIVPGVVCPVCGRHCRMRADGAVSKYCGRACALAYARGVQRRKREAAEEAAWRESIQ